MNGIHDLGGMHGFGPVQPEAREPVFHQEWERRAFAFTLAAGFLGTWNLDMTREAREQMPPAEYLASSYYEHWLFGVQRQLVHAGLVTEGELASGRPAGPVPAGVRVLKAADVPKVLRVRRVARMDDHLAAPRYQRGDRVRTINAHPVGHTRLPRYARGKAGTVDRDHGVFIFPDTHAATGVKEPQRCYSVRFEGRELWGHGARDAVYVDCFEPYLEPA